MAQANKQNWVQDDKITNCTKCKDQFGLVKRKHHCRVCGNVFCSKCCVNFTEKNGQKTRLCNTCALKEGDKHYHESVEIYKESSPKSSRRTELFTKESTSPRPSRRADTVASPPVSPRGPPRNAPVFEASEPGIDWNKPLEGDELNRVFAQLLVELGVPAESMDNLPPAKKWLLITQHKQSLSDESSPGYYISLLESKRISKDQITHLRISLNSSPLSWISEFIKLDGIALLTSLVADNSKMKDRQSSDTLIDLEVILCLKAIMNTKVGMPIISQRADVPNSLIYLMNSSETRIKTNLAEFLSVVCVTSPVGLQNVLKAFRLFKEQAKEEKRFSTLVKSLATQPYTEEYLVNAMSLINCMVNSPTDIYTRVRLRGNFLQLGIINIIKTLRSLNDANLLVQLDVFEDALEADAKEVKSSGIEVTTVDEEDPNKIFAALRNIAENSQYKGAFVETLRFLLDFSTEAGTGPKIWRIYESISAQLTKLRDSQEVSEKEEDEIVVGTNSTTHFFKMKHSLMMQVQAVQKMFQAANAQVAALRKETEDKNKMIASLMSQNKDLSNQGFTTATVPVLSGPPKRNFLGSRSPSQSDLRKLVASDTQKLEQELMELKIANQELHDKCNEYLKQIKQAETSVPVSPKSAPAQAFAETPGPPPPRPSTPPPSLSPPPPPAAPVSSPPVPPSDSATPSTSAPPDPSDSTLSPAPPTGPPPPPGNPPPPPPGDAPPPPPGEAPPPPSGAGPPPPPGAGPPPPPGAGPSPPSGAGPPPPPPPPMGKKKAASTASAKNYIVPAVKMKQFNWTKISNNQVTNTVWEKLDDTAVKIDAAALESMFCARVVAEVPKEKDKPTTITLIDPRKANNCAIMLTKFKNVDFKELKKAIVNMDENIIDAEGARGLATFAPSEEDIEAIKAYEGDPSMLGKAEQFYKEIMGVPRITQRLQCMSFYLSFAKVVQDTKPDIEAVLAASEEIQNSKKFPQVIEVILAVGNFINGGSARGAAAGFKLDSLLKIRDTQSNNPIISTALHYIISFVESKQPQLLSFYEELTHAEQAAKANTSSIASTLASLKKGLAQVEQEITKPHDAGFIEKMKTFVETAASEIKQMEELANKMEATYKSVTKFYGEPSAKPEDFFGTIFAFITAFKKTQEDLHNKKAAAAKAAEKDAKKKQIEELQAKMKVGVPALKPIQIPPGADVERGAMDNMIAAIRAGAAFRRN